MGSSLIRLGLLVLLAASIFVGACTIERGDVRTPGGQPPEADTTRVRLTMEAIAAAFETGDLASLDTICHDSITVFEAGRVQRGWADYREHHLLPELEALSQRRLRIYDVRVRLARNTAWATYGFRLSAVRDGQDVEARGAGTTIMQNLQGSWRLVHSHTSVAEDPPGEDGG
jgi:ketosteroid isomerase-like protein